MTGLGLGQPVWLVLVPVPILVYWLRSTAPRVGVTFSSVSLLRDDSGRSSWRLRCQPWLDVLHAFGLVLLVLAITRPFLWLVRDKRCGPEHRLVLVVDVTGSMGKVTAQDETGQSLTRLGVVQRLMHEYLSRLAGPVSLAVLSFAETPTVVCAETEDARFADEAIRRLTIDVVDNRTELGAALALAVDVAEKMPRPSVIVLATDGAQRVPDALGPLAGARIAEAFRIPVVVVNPFWKETAETDQQTLERIVSISSGQLVRSKDRAKLDQAVQKTIAQQTPGVDVDRQRPIGEKFELFPHFILVAFGILVLVTTLRNTWLRVHPKTGLET